MFKGEDKIFEQVIYAKSILVSYSKCIIKYINTYMIFRLNMRENR